MGQTSQTGSIVPPRHQPLAARTVWRQLESFWPTACHGSSAPSSSIPVSQKLRDCFLNKFRKRPYVGIFSVFEHNVAAPWWQKEYDDSNTALERQGEDNVCAYAGVNRSYTCVANQSVLLNLLFIFPYHDFQ